MKSNRLILCSVVAAWLAWSPVHAQTGGYQPLVAPPPAVPAVQTEPPLVSAYAPSGGFSDWIMYQRPCCEGKDGKQTPLFTEIYLRAGPSFPFGGQTLSRELQTGWSIMGGARALFFNQPMDRAWTIDLHMINTNESGNNTGKAFPVVIFTGPSKTVLTTPGVTVKASNRTMVGLGLGREYYLWAPADSGGNVCRVGWDAGGRYGSQRIDTNESRRLVDTIGGVFAAVHADVDIPCNIGVVFTGVRLEWAYTWSDVLQRTSDVQDINLFWTVGLRY